jgi:hypothetical protein
MCAFSAVLTTPAHSPEQPAVVSDLLLHGRSRRAHLHHQCSTTTSDTISYIATSSCVRGAQISASFRHHSRRAKPSTDTARMTIKKISVKPTSRRSSHAPAGGAGRAAYGQRSIRPGDTGFSAPTDSVPGRRRLITHRVTTRATEETRPAARPTLQGRPTAAIGVERPLLAEWRAGPSQVLGDGEDARAVRIGGCGYEWTR